MRTLHGIIEKRERLRPGVWCILGFVDLKWKARHCRPVPSNLPSCPNCWRWTEPLILTAPTTLTETTQTSVLSCGLGLLKSLESEFSGFFGRLAEDPRISPGDCSSVQLVSLKACLSVLSATKNTHFSVDIRVIGASSCFINDSPSPCNHLQPEAKTYAPPNHLSPAGR